MGRLGKHWFCPLLQIYKEIHSMFLIGLIILLLMRKVRKKWREKAKYRHMVCPRRTRKKIKRCFNKKNVFVFTFKEISWKENKTMLDFYQEEWVPFGEMLVAMESEGIKVNINYLKNIEKIAMQDYDKYKVKINNFFVCLKCFFFKARFLEWATKKCPEAAFMNIESDAQKQQLLFAPCFNQKNKKKVLEEERSFDTPNVVNYIEPGKFISHVFPRKSIDKFTFKKMFLLEKKFVTNSH